MAVGLVVDYSMHMAHSFGLQDGSLPRAKRAELAMKEMGQPIFMGVSTTFLAILPLAFSASQVFRVFFKMFFGIVLAGGSHGLIFLPVCMSMFGPSVTNTDAEAAARKVADVETLFEDLTLWTWWHSPRVQIRNPCGHLGFTWMANMTDTRVKLFESVDPAFMVQLRDDPGLFMKFTSDMRSRMILPLDPAAIWCKENSFRKILDSMNVNSAERCSKLTS
ncbi:Niemann-Pick C1 protein [Symbiodinium microadriaticum]|uniref:Niemann-Pick C1 protein n=1 Tax=Symbiodinium microadriaticum TaxID=2951 RepID=A0A1Q9C652_SYMMI|nr:Niemann-Pick C1 protein [Symbiodinium microadriaticum]